jgi:group I intron endonuclease
MIGYKHTKEALLKMTNRFKDKNNHPMYGKIHSNKTKNLISKKLSRYPLGVGIYDLNNNLIHKFQNNVELSKYLNVSKVTVGKYLNKGLIYKNKYIFKPINID